MKAITICQPYAGAIMDGRKRVENRGWRTNYRGPLIIHAGKSLQWMKTWNDVADGPLPDEMHLGAVVGVANLAAVYDLNEIRRERQVHWILTHHHASGPFCWALENVRKLVTPIEYNGKQGLWEPTDLIASPEWQSAKFEYVLPVQELKS
ncbi:ASCH domain-containing protein [Gimesia sp.]|uniref:ASCH domain-containing protein n=1 Tax=Gimesia sp. TaxID=2024833 RepID=UPI003A8F1633